ncbi:MAG: hypothetical protein LBR26_01715 [Prevotella sp.]|nr:hypothetical protein [Prevotella sp.]
MDTRKDGINSAFSRTGAILNGTGAILNRSGAIFIWTGAIPDSTQLYSPGYLTV